MVLPMMKKRQIRAFPEPLLQAFGSMFQEWCRLRGVEWMDNRSAVERLIDQATGRECELIEEFSKFVDDIMARLPKDEATAD